MTVLPLRRELEEYLRMRNLLRKYDKQARLFSENPSHPGLNTELLEPTHLRFWSFRIDRKYRAIFYFVSPHFIEIIDINNHYR